MQKTHCVLWRMVCGEGEGHQRGFRPPLLSMKKWQWVEKTDAEMLV